MPALMAACDALVENAGGLTSLEAMRAGLPVVSFQPIAGHGRENTARMAEAGVSRLAAIPTSSSMPWGPLPRPGRPDAPRSRPDGPCSGPARTSLTLEAAATRLPSRPAAAPTGRSTSAGPRPPSSVVAALAGPA